MSNTLVILFHELDKFHFNDDQILHHHYSVPDPQYTDNEKHFGKSCQNVFPVISMCIIFFGLNIFFSPVSPEFAVSMGLQETVISPFSLSESSLCLSPPYPCHRLFSAAPPSFTNRDATSVHSTPDESQHGLLQNCLKLLSPHWKQVIRDILGSLGLLFMVGSH